MGGPICFIRLVTLLFITVILPNGNLLAKSKSLNVQYAQWPWSLAVAGVPAVQEIKYTCTAGFEEQDFDLGCLVSGFSGYFHPSRWRTCSVSGDGGVDVTGAPQPKLLVEGIRGDLIEVANAACRDFSILIPADGYVSFKWENVGSSLLHPSTATSFLAFSINGTPQQLNRTRPAHTSTFLRKGDRISFRLLGDNPVSLIIRDFAFLNNTAVSLAEVVIPNSLELYLEDFSQLERLAQPELIGQPYVDTDGDLETLDDRIYLLDQPTALSAHWEDHITYDEQGTTLIIREWSIYDPCTGNEMQKQQQLRCYPKSINDD